MKNISKPESRDPELTRSFLQELSLQRFMDRNILFKKNFDVCTALKYIYRARTFIFSVYQKRRQSAKNYFFTYA